MAIRSGTPRATAAPEATRDLTIRMVATKRPICRGFFRRMAGSSSIPTEMKKRLMKASRNGMMSLSAWWLYSDSEMARPAMKAPSARESPASEVSQAVPRPMKMMVRMNSSRLRVLTICLKIQGTRNREP